MRTLAGLEPEQGVDVAAGKKIFADNCVVCHGEDGKGKIDLGAPELDDEGLAVRLRHQGPHLYDHLRPQQHDAGLGEPP